ncbi:hypothetical protein MANES_18G054064v8 [Manihot esculenta]|uniref:Uncharacterized protein n=1 Tax=Manihot esculenta TaxID=3983 RepID=A0ACB7FXN1_MANES|nr:hypothetical protein MANES_18G054064v8 [Manihot esculenta]
MEKFLCRSEEERKFQFLIVLCAIDCFAVLLSPEQYVWV